MVNTDNNINNVKKVQYPDNTKQNEQKKCDRGAFVEGAASKKPGFVSRVGAAAVSASHLFFLRNETTIGQAGNDAGDVFSPWNSYLKNVGMYEDLTGKKYSVLHAFQTWYDANDNEVLGGLFKKSGGRYQAFPKEFCSVADSHGSIPMVTWEPWGGFERDYSKPLLKQIIDELDAKNGKLYEYIKRWAESAKNYKKPLFLRLMHEMNSNSYPWAGIANGGGTKDKFGDKNLADGPEMYIAAWRKIYDLFKGANGVGADNVKFIWCPDSKDNPSTKSDQKTGNNRNDWNNLASYYPGQKYVDMVGLDGYLNLNADNFEYIFGEAIKTLEAKHYIQGETDPSKLTGTEKPFAICEWAAAPYPLKPKFISEAYQNFAKYHVELQSSFLINKEEDYRLISPVAGNKKNVYATYFESADAERAAVMNNEAVKGKKIERRSVKMEKIKAGSISGAEIRVIKKANAGDKKTLLELDMKEANFKVSRREDYFREGSMGILGILKLRLDDNRLRVDQTEIYSQLLNSIPGNVTDERSMGDYFSALLKVNVLYRIKDICAVKNNLSDKALMRAVIDGMKIEMAKIGGLTDDYRKAKTEAARPATNTAGDDLLTMVAAPNINKEHLTLEGYLKYFELKIVSGILEKACNSYGVVSEQTLGKEIDSAYYKGMNGIDWNVIHDMAKPGDVAKGMKKQVLLKILNRLINIPDNEYMYMSALERIAYLCSAQIGNVKSPDVLKILPKNSGNEQELNSKYTELSFIGTYKIEEATGSMEIPEEVAMSIRIYDKLIKLVSDEKYTKIVKLTDKRAVYGIIASSYAMQAAILLDYYFQAKPEPVLLVRAKQLLQKSSDALASKARSFKSPLQEDWAAIGTIAAGHDEDFFLRMKMKVLNAQIQAANGDVIAVSGALKVFKDVLSDERIRGDFRDYVKNAVILMLEKTSDPQLLSVAQGIYAEFNLGKKAETGKDKEALEDRVLNISPKN